MKSERNLNRLARADMRKLEDLIQSKKAEIEAGGMSRSKLVVKLQDEMGCRLTFANVWNASKIVGVAIPQDRKKGTPRRTSRKGYSRDLFPGYVGHGKTDQLAVFVVAMADEMQFPVPPRIRQWVNEIKEITASEEPKAAVPQPSLNGHEREV